ncbi:DegV family protein [Paenibacillus rigui]|uniref:EDD domain protein n=1 Tax=Paenibacillus rigui TaxID=554312 RepID=A0A229UQS7_9BACL|nr:DegV family protein [Paenibacillus rigui]OXM85846.1 EDD domain protein [Paenibacillus rigui]
MGQVRVVTDSTADIPVELQERLNIEIVPLKVHFGTETYSDGIDLSPQAFFAKLASFPSLPTTSQPSPVEFLDIYKKLAASSDAGIVSIHLSSGLSGTYQTAVLSSTMLEGKADLTVIDSKSASYGIGMLAVAAAEAAMAGKSKEEIVALVETMRREMRLYFLVDTLEYLQKGGRIGKAAALVGSLLNIKPILSITDQGEVYSVDKVRGHKKAMGRIVEMLQADFAGKPIHVTVAHADTLSAADELSGLLKQHFEVKSMQYTTIGSVIGTHAGPGAVAAFVSPA